MAYGKMPCGACRATGKAIHFTPEFKALTAETYYDVDMEDETELARFFYLRDCPICEGTGYCDEDSAAAWFEAREHLELKPDEEEVDYVQLLRLLGWQDPRSKGRLN